MSEFYGPQHRKLQDATGMRRVADRLEEMSHTEITSEERDFIQSRTMFFLSTVDGAGRPTVSYKGGAQGFVRVTVDNLVEFPSYDGNGMFLSLGNIATTANVGMLFIDFERPHRLRLQGSARLSCDSADLASFPGAQYLIRVTPQKVFMNCGRYIHRPGSLSHHVPRSDGQQPFPNWKRLNFFADTLSEADSKKVDAAGGEIGLESYQGE